MRSALVLGSAVLFACNAAVAPGADRAPVCEGNACGSAAPALACEAASAIQRIERAPVSGDAVDEALAKIGLERASFGVGDDRLSLSKLDTTDARIFETTRAALHDPAKLPAYGRGAAAALDEALASSTPVTRSILAASALRESAASACIDESWSDVPAGDAPLASVVFGDVAGVPLDLQRALVPVVRAMNVLGEQIRGARGEQKYIAAAAGVPAWLLGVRRFELRPDVPLAFERIDAAKIVSAAASLARVVEEARLDRFAGATVPSLDLDTEIGPIVLRGPGDDVLVADGEAPAFVLDTGGNDDYRGAFAAATAARPVSVLVDLGGDDMYGYTGDDARHEGGRSLSKTGRQGSGTLGVGLLFDLGGGRDAYRSLVASQGAGSHGVGVLYDDGGDDSYEAEGFSQGAAAWGVGLLLDRAGRDRYTLHNSGQGFGFTRGVGAIVDSSGDDRYVAVATESIRYPADQLEGKANHSFAQGCGAGHRPDWPDAGYPFPGGIGILRDASGDDRYEAGVFAQACGFVLGLGVLLDGGGADAYDGLYYVQGTAAHLGAALFFEASGDDRYDQNARPQGPALGMAHDLSVAVLIDAGGDDRYRASWSSFGAALANGAAVFADDGGADRFDTDDDDAYGVARTSDVRSERTQLPTIGVFVKAGGAGTYVGKGAARPGSAWRSAGTKVELGVGVDRPQTRASL